MSLSQVGGDVTHSLARLYMQLFPIFGVCSAGFSGSGSDLIDCIILGFSVAFTLAAGAFALAAGVADASIW
jgi:hypothetical protein